LEAIGEKYEYQTHCYTNVSKIEDSKARVHLNKPMMLNILVCQIFQIHKPLFSTFRTITKVTVQWEWPASSKVQSPVSEQELMYLKFMLA